MQASYDLFNLVIQQSQSKNWSEAVLEWEVIDCTEDETCSTECVCGKEGIKYLFTIRNKFNGQEIFPIGSSCIKKFNNNDLTAETELWKKEFALYHAISNNEFIKFEGEEKNRLFSRKLLEKLYDEGAFKANQFNDFNPYNDYEFLLKMFNKRTEMSERQNRRCVAIILNSIKPFVQNKLRSKSKNVLRSERP